jgi:hypothetical protein
MNRRTTHTRLARLEAQQAKPPHRTFEVWVGTGEDDLLGPNGDVMSVAEFERRYPHAMSIDDLPSTEHPHANDQATHCTARSPPSHRR